MSNAPADDGTVSPVDSPPPSPTPRSDRIRPLLAGIAVPVLAVAAALAVGAVLISALGASPVDGYLGMVRGSLGGWDALGRTVTRGVPVMLVAAGVCLAFRASVINIGGEGQIIVGALACAALGLALPESMPRLLALPLVLVAAAIGGAAYGSIPGFLKARFAVNEILSTIMLNIVAVQLMSFLLQGPMIDPSQDSVLSNIPQTRRLPQSTDLPILHGRSHIDGGIVVAVIGAVVAYTLLWKTTAGFRLRAVGHSRDAAKYAGIPVQRSIVSALALSGLFCGLAGGILVLGSESHRLFSDGSSAGFTGNAGFNGIIAALFGSLHPIWSIPASLLFGALLVGANQLQRDVQVPAALITALNGIVVMFVVSSDRLRKRLTTPAKSSEAAEA